MSDEVHGTGVNEGRIKDSAAAHDLAKMVNAGWDKALKGEKVLIEKLTDEQKEQLRILESLPGKYPHAFVPDEAGSLIRIGGETGLRYLLTRPRSKDDKDFGSVIVFTQEGYIFVGRAGGFSRRELTETDFSVVFVDNGKHKREITQIGDGELIEFPVADGKAFYKAYRRDRVTERTAPVLKIYLSEMERYGLDQDEKKAKQVDVLGLI